MGSRTLLYRREFLRRSALAAASVAGVACTPGATAPSGSAVAKSLTPTKGGTLTWGQWDKIDSIDPSRMSSPSSSCASVMTRGTSVRMTLL